MIQPATMMAILIDSRRVAAALHEACRGSAALFAVGRQMCPRRPPVGEARARHLLASARFGLAVPDLHRSVGGRVCPAMDDPTTRPEQPVLRLTVDGEISGSLLERDQALQLRDIGSRGFLAEMHESPPVGSVHHARLVGRNGFTALVAVRCAHCRRRPDVVGPHRYLVGFAFLTANTSAIDRLIDQLTSVE
jgi:hypothetical protein